MGQMKTRANLFKTAILKDTDVQCQWFVIDATDKILGRLASEIAKILRGKHRVDYTPHVDCGDGVIVINAEKVRVTGNKEAQIVYYHHSSYPGGQKAIPYRTQMERHPDRIIQHAVAGMVPHGSQSKKQLTRLRVFAGNEHNMEAQKPKTINI